MQSIHKPKDGKLIRIKADLDKNMIKGITISGDFFIYPEERIADIEKSMIGLDMHDRKSLGEAIAFACKDTEMVGISPEAICDVVAKLSDLMKND